MIDVLAKVRNRWINYAALAGVAFSLGYGLAVVDTACRFPDWLGRFL
jgi:hypothetical protein